jgi:hypothetical protein
MLLRHHPLMSRHGVRNWPPVWMWLDGGEDEQPTGEVGTLKAVLLSRMQAADRCFLLISHQGSSYIGCLLFDDPAFCRQIVNLMKDYWDRPIAEIGSLQLSYTL